MSFLKDFFTPKQEPGPPLSVVLHPFYPQSLLLPGYEPLTIPFERILGIFFGASAIVFIAVWLASGASFPFMAASVAYCQLNGGDGEKETSSLQFTCRESLPLQHRRTTDSDVAGHNRHHPHASRG